MSSSASRKRKEAEAAEAAAPPAANAVWEQISTLLVAIVIALGIRAFVVEPYRIPSGSMLPTLLVGDHLFVNKFIYGVKLPFSDWRSPGIREPERGDVVVFTVAKDGSAIFPADLRPDLPREEFVKRIIGLPGDHIDLRSGLVYVNDEPIAARPIAETFVDDGGTPLDVREVTLGSHEFRILDDPRGSVPISPVTVAPGRYFMLGDNRDHSMDSRFWGTVRLAEIKGPAFILYWSWDFAGSWAELLNPLKLFELLTQKMRWDRLGERVH